MAEFVGNSQSIAGIFKFSIFFAKANRRIWFKDIRNTLNSISALAGNAF
jgi:hypothetical protein